MDPMSAAVATVVYGVISGLIGNQIDEEVSNNLIKKNIRKWIKKTNRPVNHDIERAIRRAELNATLIFLKEYIREYKEKKRFIKLTPNELIQIRKYLQNEKNILLKPAFSPSENLIDFEIEELLKPNNLSTTIIQFKKSIITELTNNVDKLPDGFQNAILNGIEIDNNIVDWYDLMSSFFVETVKTNERVKTAIENDFLAEIKTDVKQQNLELNLSVANLSNQISDSNQSIINKIDEIDTKLDDFFEQLVVLLNSENLNGSVLSSEVKKKKDEIKNRIEKLTNFITVLQKEDHRNADTIIDNHASFEHVDFDDIIDALRNESCILFIGPDISTDKDGDSLHENYFKSISNKHIKYNTNDSFFLPGPEGKIRNKAKQYYLDVFPEQNEIGNTILEKLAQIPFKLIISYAPDDTMSRIFKKHNIDHKCFEYIADTETVVERENDNKEPIIYNAFGNAAKNGKYIYSHRQFNEFSKAEPQKRIPKNIESELTEGTNYLFVGFDFNKWYYRAMMFDLKIKKDGEDGERLVIDAKNKTETFNRDFIKKQFDVNFIDTDYDNLATLLLKKSQEAGLSKSLNATFTKSILNELETIRLRSTDTDKLEVLSNLFSDLDSIEQKIIENKE